ncbi:NAD(P)H-hydrate dehydratase [Marinivivus vitaminiproducens]|uniref:NAD(P)H-hydrate dehydratase n=1 Tax=Marinivivus vitaminiproducens TaxID=3035935 RepID=UPI0027A00CCF|nr:NAD(P)H-hydrate dehydratase [Geminicoccaceae bacterium SCSIO 64248]
MALVREPLPGRILSIAEMAGADAQAIESGRPGWWLMENAGAAVAAAIRARFSQRPVAILCGPGNNGGDGFVIARHLSEAGWPVRIGLLGDRAALKGDAARAAGLWQDVTAPLSPDLLEGSALVVDALFGAGLAKPVDGRAREVLEAVQAAHVPVVAVDVPSGVHGDTGDVMGFAVQAVLTVTFGRPKPGHLLLPGRTLAGELVIADIGLPERALRPDGPSLDVNTPELWLSAFPRRRPEGHKYTYGHALVQGGDAGHSGATRMAARAALRAGAGLVTLACAAEALPIYAQSSLAVMVSVLDDDEAFAAFLAERKVACVLLGPGGGAGERLAARVLHVLGKGMPAVLDADALTSFKDASDRLFGALSSSCLLTPHAGEFQRLFPAEGGKVAITRDAARRSGAVVLLKGSDTVVAAPDGRAAIAAASPPELATAGSGDVLAGIALGLIAQGMPTFEAACAAVWLHAEAAARFGPGLIAEDIEGQLPAVLRDLLAL